MSAGGTVNVTNRLKIPNTLLIMEVPQKQYGPKKSANCCYKDHCMLIISFEFIFYFQHNVNPMYDDGS